MLDRDWWKRRVDEGPPAPKDVNKVSHKYIRLFFDELGRAIKRKLRRKRNG